MQVRTCAAARQPGSSFEIDAERLPVAVTDDEAGVGLLGRPSLWALLRPLPGKPFPNGWDFCVEACVPQDRDRFVFGDFVVVIAALLDGLDECGELLLVDQGLGATAIRQRRCVLAF